MRHALYVHVVWTTRDREPLIDAECAEFIWRYSCEVTEQERASVVAGGFVTTHVHFVLRLHPLTNIPHLLQRLKGGTSVLATKEGHTSVARPLRWAKGYSIQSVSPRALPKVITYVRSQAQRHPNEVIEGWRGNLAGE